MELVSHGVWIKWDLSKMKITWKLEPFPFSFLLWAVYESERGGETAVSPGCPHNLEARSGSVVYVGQEDNLVCVYSPEERRVWPGLKTEACQVREPFAGLQGEGMTVMAFPKSSWLLRVPCSVSVEDVDGHWNQKKGVKVGCVQDGKGSWRSSC